jgi:hypothetical protein
MKKQKTKKPLYVGVPKPEKTLIPRDSLYVPDSSVARRNVRGKKK